ncbi:PREDICTED: solute carrier organic anion transporter family member 4A1-like [Branchiostoma belcheri]|uniref:Solute carrier organic anion transporter family member n=1 Tax=Branchiostoma belcheri TaxID=7741 RepID=A0A6P4ZJQ2_BRABE|nr:PREDICTED: solute carrier organic anion transporter family member 4A1-like [Branchiostoma belcheri]
MSMFSSLPDLRQAALNQTARPLLDTTPRYQPFKTPDQILEEKKGRLRFGWFGFTPDFLQFFNTSRWLVFFMSIAAYVDCTTMAFIPGIVSTLEKRFEMSSAQSGFIISSSQIFALVTVPIITHIGGKYHKGKLIGLGVLMFGIGAFLFASPHYWTGPYKVPGGGFMMNMTSSLMPNTLCQASTNGSSAEQCGGSSQNYSDLSNYLYVFVVAQFFLCLCGGPMFTVGVAYLDENVKKKVSGVYVAVLYTVACVGPSIGFLVIAQLLSLYVEWPSEDGYSAGLTPWDPRWVGNWWLGFPVLGFLGILVAIPLLAFPRKLPGSEELEEEEEEELPTKADIVKTEDDKAGVGLKGKPVEALKDLLRSLRDLLKSYAFSLLTLGVSIDAMAYMGLFAFAPKVCELLFGLSVMSSSTYFGLSMVPGAALGSLIGGWISKKIGVNCKRLLLYVFAAFVLSGLGVFVFLMYCPEAHKAYVSIDNSMTCSTECGCADSLYDPVCGGNGVEYQSPCHAGCAAKNYTTMMYTGCGCNLGGGIQSNVTTNVTSYATHGACPRNCGSHVLPVFFVVLFLMGFIGSTAGPAFTAVTLRLVPPKLRSFGLGMQWTLMRIIGMIPGPIVYGRAMDNACVQWQTSCGQRGACLVYDSRKVGLFVFGLGTGLRVVGVALCFLAYLVCKPTPEDTPDNDDDKNVLKSDKEAQA